MLCGRWHVSQYARARGLIVFGRALPVVVMALGVAVGVLGHVFSYMAARHNTFISCDESGAPVTDSWVTGYPPQVYCQHEGLTYVGTDTVLTIQMVWLCTVVLLVLGLVMYVFPKSKYVHD